MEPKFYTKVLDHEGNVLLDKTDTQETHRVIRETTAWLLTDAMKDVLTSGTGGRAYFGASMAQAGKSGTTTNDRDSLWAGYTPYYTCAVWGGYDDNSIQYTTSYPQNIWREVMRRLHADLPYKDFEMPSSITTATVCRKSGQLAIDDLCNLDQRGSQVYTEYFANGTVPGDSCEHHEAFDICNESGMIATEYCPEEEVTRTVFIIGGSSSTADGPYLATEEFLGETCTIHTEASTEPDTPDVPDVPDVVIPDVDVPSTNPDEGNNSEESGNNSGTSGGTSVLPLLP